MSIHFFMEKNKKTLSQNYHQIQLKYNSSVQMNGILVSTMNISYFLFNQSSP